MAPLDFRYSTFLGYDMHEGHIKSTHALVSSPPLQHPRSSERNWLRARWRLVVAVACGTYTCRRQDLHHTCARCGVSRWVTRAGEVGTIHRYGTITSRSYWKVISVK